MKENQSGFISGIDKGALNERRLYDLGFVKGQKIKCNNIGALGSPIAFTVQGTKFALRKKDAQKIGVVI